MTRETGGPAVEKALLEACQSRDPHAAEELVLRCEPQLMRVALRLVRRRDIAEEIVQEAFYKTFREIDGILSEHGPRPFMLRVVVNLARNRLASHSKAEVSEDFDTSSPSLFGPEPTDPEQLVASGEAWRRVDAAVGRLSPKLREVVLLHYVEGLPFAQLAPILRTSATVLRMRALRARAQLRGMLSELAQWK